MGTRHRCERNFCYRPRWVAKRRPDATTWFPALPGHPPGYCQPRWTLGPGYEPARARGDGVPIRDVNGSAGRGALPQAGRQPLETFIASDGSGQYLIFNENVGAVDGWINRGRFHSMKTGGLQVWSSAW